MTYNFNPDNNGSVTGRLARDPKFFANKDGSTTVYATVMADRTYEDKTTGKVPTDAVPLEAWVRPDKDVKSTVYGLMHRGDLVKVDYAIRVGKPYEKDGETIYPAAQLAPEFVKLLEPKAVTQARLAKRVADAEATNQAVHASSTPAESATEAPVEQPPAEHSVVGGGLDQDQLPFG